MSEMRKGTTQYKVYKLIRENEMISTEQIRKLVPANYNTIRASLIRLTNLGSIMRVHRGEYKLKTK